MSSPGFAVGYDTAIGRHLLVGGSAGEASSTLDSTPLGDRSTARLVNVGGYGRYTRGASRVVAIARGSTVSNETARSVSDGEAFAQARAAYDGSHAFARIDYSRAFSLGRLNVQPQLGYQFIRLDTDGFTESGAGVLSLVVPDREVSSHRTLDGARAVRTLTRQGGAATTLEARAAWAHEFSPLTDLRMRFAGDVADNAFAIASPGKMRNSAVVGGSAIGRLWSRALFVGSVDADLGGPVILWTASAGLRAEW